MSYGYSLKFIRLIKAIYGKVFSLVQINGHIAGPFPAQCSMRQGFPLSFLLFDVALNPSICSLDRHFTTIQIGHWSKKIVEVADTDLMIFVMAEADSPKIKELISTHERATGARLNTSKSEALSVVSWYILASVLYIPYHQEVTILGFSFTSTVARSGHLTWAAGKVQALATDTCCQDPCLEKTHTVYVCLSTLQDMAHTTNCFDTAGTGEATSNGNFIIYMARCCFEGASFNFITPVVEGSDGVDRCRQMACPFSQHASNPRKEVGVADC